MASYRTVGIVIWGMAEVAFLWCAVKPENHTLPVQIMLCAAFFVLLPLLLFNWLLGPQKGHIAHLIMIGTTFIFAAVFAFRSNIGVGVFALMVTCYLAACAALVFKYRKGFLEDARNGRRRNYFSS